MEETMTTAEVQEQTSDAFLDGWNDTVAAETADQPEFAEEAEVSEDSADQLEHAQEERTAEESQQEESLDILDAETQEVLSEPAEKEAAPKTWDLRHLDETKTVDEQGMIALAQKGLDYDRIRGKYEESKPVMELFHQFAKQAGMSVPDYVSYIRTQAKKASGMSDEDARRAVELEDREAAVSAKEEAQAERAEREKAAGQTAEQAAEKRRADIAEFQKTFPDAAKEPGSIPPSVWADVKNGLSLTAAYAKYAVNQARAQAKSAERKSAATEQNQKNAARSAGSMRSAGNDVKTNDPFLEGWNS